MSDFKNKFMDILFEDEPEDEINESNKGISSSDTNKGNLSFNAKDLLYKKNGSSPFIDLDETVKSFEESIAPKENEEYELSSQISPIFGVIKKEEKKVVKVAPEIIKSQTIKPSDSHLDIITSPIYGYGNKEDAIDNNYDVKGISEDEVIDEDEQLHNLFDNNDPSDIDVMSNDNFDEEDISLFRLFGENK